MKLYRIQAFVYGSYLNGNVEGPDERAALLKFAELVEQGQIKVDSSNEQSLRGFYSDNRVRITYEEFTNGVTNDGTGEAKLRAQMGSVGYIRSTGRDESGLISNKGPEETDRKQS
tara:strand:+ start:964 stop:1308 length:345 start_codon:yes stop_codon:yes gene_type:complete